MTAPAGPFHPVIAQAIVEGRLSMAEAPTVGYTRDQVWGIGRAVERQVLTDIAEGNYEVLERQA